VYQLRLAGNLILATCSLIRTKPKIPKHRVLRQVRVNPLDYIHSSQAQVDGTQRWKRNFTSRCQDLRVLGNPRSQNYWQERSELMLWTMTSSNRNFWKTQCRLTKHQSRLIHCSGPQLNRSCRKDFQSSWIVPATSRKRSRQDMRWPRNIITGIYMLSVGSMISAF